MAVGNLKSGKLATAKENLSNAGDYGNAADLLQVVSEHIERGFAGVYQNEDNPEEYPGVYCMIDHDSLKVSYEAYFQDDVTEESYVGAVLQEDGSLLLIDTYDGTLTASEYDMHFVKESTHKFQPDTSVYSRGGTMGYLPPSRSKTTIRLTTDGSSIIESYRNLSENRNGEEIEVSDSYTFKKIGDIG